MRIIGSISLFCSSPLPGTMKCPACGKKFTTREALQAHGPGCRSMKAREFSIAKRQSLAKTGAALPGGGFPIQNLQDLANAKRAVGRAKNPSAARAHINKRAKALGAKPIGAS